MSANRVEKINATKKIREIANLYTRTRLRYSSTPQQNIAEETDELLENIELELKENSSPESSIDGPFEIANTFPITKMASLRNVTKLIPQFKGDYQDLPRFIKSIELAMATEESLDQEENAQIKLNIIQYIIVNLIDSKTYNKIKDKEIASVASLHKAMKEELLKNIEPEHVLKQIYDCKQKFGENVETYGTKIKKLREQYEDTLENASDLNLEPIKHYNEKLIVKSFIKGARPELRTLLLTKEFENLDEAVQWAHKKEKQANYTLTSEEELEKLKWQAQKLQIQPFRANFDQNKMPQSRFFQYKNYQRMQNNNFNQGNRFQSFPDRHNQQRFNPFSGIRYNNPNPYNRLETRNHPMEYNQQAQFENKENRNLDQGETSYGHRNQTNPKFLPVKFKPAVNNASGNNGVYFGNSGNSPRNESKN